MEYVSQFGVVRQYGRGEGRDELYDASAKPALGAHNFIEVVVNEMGPVPNVGTGYGKDAAFLPAGAVIVAGNLLVDSKGSAANVKLDLVKKDGSDAQALLAAVVSPADNSVNKCEGAAIGTRLAEDRYVKASGTLTGLKAKLVIEYI